MLDEVNMIIASTYDDAYLRRYRVMHNFKESGEEDDLKRHPDYINFCRKYIVGKESDDNLGLYDDDELGEFDKGWLKESYDID
jgi:hypothetical protein